MLTNIRVFSLHAIEKHQPAENEALISIGGDHVRKSLPSGFVAILPLNFLDADLKDDLVSTGSFAGANRLFPGCFQPAQARLVKRMVHDLQSSKKPYTLSIHCHAGQSRSAAIAKFLVDYYGIPCDSDLSRHNRYVYGVLNGDYDAYLCGNSFFAKALEFFARRGIGA